MFKQLALAAIIASATLLAPVTAAEAAPAEQACQPSAFRQHDMAGTYVSHNMRLDVYACGGSVLAWRNAYGEHFASYYSSVRLPGGGVGAYGTQPDPSLGRYLDSADTIGYKPAEKGYIQVITVDTYANIIGVYRLRQL